MKKGKKVCPHCGSAKCNCRKMSPGGIIMRGTGAATKGKKCRGPMA